MEFHKLIYDIDFVEHTVKKLADLSKTESLAEIINEAERDEDGKIKRAVFSWSRKSCYPIRKFAIKLNRCCDSIGKTG